MPLATNLVDLHLEDKLSASNLVSWAYKNFKRYKQGQIYGYELNRPANRPTNPPTWQCVESRDEN